MSLTTGLTAVMALAAVSYGYPMPPYAVEQSETYVPALPVGLQLPLEQAPAVPFYPAPPAETLSAPQYRGVEPNYYQVPVPSQDLVAPVETQWNPNNDPKLYYKLPPVVTKEELPTATLPKKYNKDIHTKSKPYSSKPKQEITLEPINESQYLSKQKELQKTFQKLAKKENQKLVQAEQNLKPVDLDSQELQQHVEVPKIKQHTNGEKPTKLVEAHNPKATIALPEKPVKNDVAQKVDPVGAESNFERDYDGPRYDTGLSPHLTASLGIPHNHASSAKGERLNFHMVGHDGPMSYKWGYDTGKGHNRHFHFEERDKDGLVKGHYGYYDDHGKLRIVEYDAHPHHGFHASEPEGGYHK